MNPDSKYNQQTYLFIDKCEVDPKNPQSYSCESTIAKVCSVNINDQQRICDEQHAKQLGQSTHYINKYNTGGSTFEVRGQKMTTDMEYHMQYEKPGKPGISRPLWNETIQNYIFRQ